jgi:hypothetical protein
MMTNNEMSKVLKTLEQSQKAREQWSKSDDALIEMVKASMKEQGKLMKKEFAKKKRIEID